MQTINEEHARLIREAEGPQGLGYAQQNGARYYNIVTPKPNGEAIVEMYVVRNRYAPSKSGKRGQKLPEVEMFRACRYETDETEMHFHNFDYLGLAGYRVFWSDSFTPDGYHVGEFDWDYDYKFNGGMLVRNVQYLNGFTGTKYAHGFDTKGALHIMEYADLYRISPRVEFLVKAGFGNLLTPTFVRRLADDNRYFNFFRSNAREIQERKAGLAVINHAYSTRGTIRAAQLWFDCKRECASIAAEIRKGESCEKICAYLHKQNATANQYAHYLDMCGNFGIHLDQFVVRYPRDFHAAFEELDQRRLRQEAVRLRREAIARKRAEAKTNAALAAIALRLAKALRKGKHDQYQAIMPSNCDELRAEGNAMHNCIGGYGDRIAAGKCVCVFVRDAEGEPFADIEIKDGKVVQCYEKYNKPTSAEVRAYADRLAAKIGKAMKKSA